MLHIFFSFRLRDRFAAVLLLCCSLSAHAQDVSQPVAPASAPVAVAPLRAPGQVSGGYKEYLYQRYAGDKEARAVVHMFGRKQTGGVIWLLGGAAFLGYLQSQTGTTTNGNSSVTFKISPLGYIIFAGLPAGIAIGKFSRFSNSELYKALNDYEKEHAFRGYINAKLKRSDYL